MILSVTTSKLEIKPTVGVTTDELEFVASYVEVDTTTNSWTPKEKTGTTNSTNYVEIVPTPATGKSHTLINLHVFNADTVAATIGIFHNANGTRFTRAEATLDPGETLEYEKGYGFSRISL